MQIKTFPEKKSDTIMPDSSIKSASTKGTQPDSPRDQSTETRDTLVKAAFGLFAQKGFDSVSIKQIGQWADMSPAMIYYYFKDKENLFHQCISSAVEEINGKFRELSSQNSDPVELLKIWFRVQRENYLAISKLVKVMIDYSMIENRTSVIDELITRFYVFEIRLLTGAISAGVDSGRFRPVDPGRLANLISVHLDGVMARAVIQPQRDVGADIDDIENLLWRHLS